MHNNYFRLLANILSLSFFCQKQKFYTTTLNIIFYILCISDKFFYIFLFIFIVP